MPKKNNDPYTGILGIMSNVGGNAGKQAMPGIGTIVSPPPNLVVSFNGMELNSNFLWVDEYWLQGHYREMLIPIVGDDESTAEQYFVYGKCRRLDGNE